MREVKIRFVFSNYDRVNLIINTNTSITVGELKIILTGNWPPGNY